MLTSIQIENFRCLKSVDVPLKPLTVLIGKNDTGKSAFLTAIRFLADACNTEETDIWRHDKELAVGVSGRTSDSTLSRNPGGGCKVDPRGHNPLDSTEVFQLPADGVVMESGGHSDQGDAPRLASDGANVAAVLDYYFRRDRERFNSIEEALRSLVPGLESLVPGTPQPASRRVELRIDKGLEILAKDASTGVRLLIFFLALAYHPAPPKVCLIEEPETGIHPKRLGDVVRLLREITQGVHGDHPAQVILSTHSPYLLDSINPETDQVLVFRRYDDGSRDAKPVDTERLKSFLDDFMLGEIWYNQEEAGLLKKTK